MQNSKLYTFLVFWFKALMQIFSNKTLKEQSSLAYRHFLFYKITQKAIITVALSMRSCLEFVSTLWLSWFVSLQELLA